MDPVFAFEVVLVGAEDIPFEYSHYLDKVASIVGAEVLKLYSLLLKLLLGLFPLLVLKLLISKFIPSSLDSRCNVEHDSRGKSFSPPSSKFQLQYK